MKLAPLNFYLTILLAHLFISIPFWFFLPMFNYVLLFTFIFISLFASTKDGESFFNSEY
jgi:hypothetical protein